MKAKLKFRFTKVKVKLFFFWVRLSRYKAIEFDLEDLDDYRAFRRCAHADDLHNALWDLDQWLRARVKYANDYNLSKHQRIKFWAKVEGFSEAREKLHELLGSINLDEI